MPRWTYPPVRENGRKRQGSFGDRSHLPHRLLPKKRYGGFHKKAASLQASIGPDYIERLQAVWRVRDPFS